MTIIQQNHVLIMAGMEWIVLIFHRSSVWDISRIYGPYQWFVFITKRGCVFNIIARQHPNKCQIWDSPNSFFWGDNHSIWIAPKQCLTPGNRGGAPIQSGMEVRIMAQDHMPKPLGWSGGNAGFLQGRCTNRFFCAMGYGHPQWESWVWLYKLLLQYVVDWTKNGRTNWNMWASSEMRYCYTKCAMSIDQKCFFNATR